MPQLRLPRGDHPRFCTGQKNCLWFSLQLKISEPGGKKSPGGHSRPGTNAPGRGEVVEPIVHGSSKRVKTALKPHECKWGWNHRHGTESRWLIISPVNFCGWEHGSLNCGLSYMVHQVPIREKNNRFIAEVETDSNLLSMKRMKLIGSNDNRKNDTTGTGIKIHYIITLLVSKRCAIWRNTFLNTYIFSFRGSYNCGRWCQLCNSILPQSFLGEKIHVWNKMQGMTECKEWIIQKKWMFKWCE